jgi:pimeloyl-ACP methyl ester carboxylesterase
MTTFALIPGAGGEGWYWHRVVPELETRGHDVVAVDLPADDDAAGWTEYADSIVRAIGGRSELILVAQSLAGFSAPLVCERVPVNLLVLLNAMIPKAGETGSEWWSNTGQGAAQREYLDDIGLSPEGAEDDIVLYFHDVPEDVTAEAYRRGDPDQSMTPMRQPLPLTAWPDVPTRVLIGRDDRIFPAAFQRRAARERLGLDADEMPGGHLVALSQPQELAERLDAYRREINEHRDDR